jgi:hypothetical protein
MNTVVNEHSNRLIRAAIALQVAALEWEQKDISDEQAYVGIDAAVKAIIKTVKQMKADD